MVLTQFAIVEAKAAEKPYKLADGGGLHLLVRPSFALNRNSGHC
jgi:hypothetical protein